jgi:hypothetical protein
LQTVKYITTDQVHKHQVYYVLLAPKVSQLIQVVHYVFHAQHSQLLAHGLEQLLDGFGTHQQQPGLLAQLTLPHVLLEHQPQLLPSQHHV